MASACVNNIPTTYSNTHNTKNWFSNPRTSLSHDYNNNNNNSKKTTTTSSSSKSDLIESSSSSSNNNTNAGDFNFQLGSNTVTMLPADELFSDGKLLPLHLSSQKSPQLPPLLNNDVARVSISSSPPPPPPPKELLEIKGSSSESDNPYLFSPKAPRCSSRWKELLGLKKTITHLSSTTSASNNNNNNGCSSSSRSIKQLLNRNSKTTAADSSSMRLPLLKDSSSSSPSASCNNVMEYEAKDSSSNNNNSSRLSLSTSSSSSQDELPRLSLDTERPNKKKQQQQPKRCHSTGPRMRPSVRRPRTRKKETTTTMPTTRGVVTIESPRMGPSGRVVFESLERSSSCPSSFNGGLRYHNNNNNNYKGVMERSYSGNVSVRITPVLNVPVCSLRGSSKFGFANLFSSSSHSQSQKKEGNNNSSSNNNNNNGGNNNYVKNFNNLTSSKIKEKN